MKISFEMWSGIGITHWHSAPSKLWVFCMEGNKKTTGYTGDYESIISIKMNLLKSL